MPEPLATLARAAAGRIRLVALDVDGVLTDGGVYIGDTADRPVELKRFDIQDGIGIVLLKDAGLRVVLVSGRVSPATTARARELDVEVVQDDAARKLAALDTLRARHDLTWDECCCVGDDLPDIPLLRRAGVAIAVANAVPEAMAAARWVTVRPGGAGAVREVAEALLRARGEWEGRVAAYLERRGEADVPAGSR